MPSWTIFVFIGITGGLAAGIFGIGGSLIIVPACNKSKPIKPLSFWVFTWSGQDRTIGIMACARQPIGRLHR